MPEPRDNENKSEWMQRCMNSEESKKSFPDSKQRYAVCINKWENKNKKKRKK